MDIIEKNVNEIHKSMLDEKSLEKLEEKVAPKKIEKKTIKFKLWWPFRGNKQKGPGEKQPKDPPRHKT